MPEFEMTQAQYNRFLKNEEKDAKNAQRRYARNRATEEIIGAFKDQYDELYGRYLRDGTHSQM